MKITKISSAGNDFIILGPAHPEVLSTVDIQEMCDRHFGIGADGVLFSDNGHWWFTNADGSPAEFCGNGARALALFEKRYSNSSKGCAITPAGSVQYSVSDANDAVALHFSADWITSLKPGPEVSAIIQQWLPVVPLEPIQFIGAGVPHACISVERLPEFPPRDEWLRFSRNTHAELIRRRADLNLTVFSKCTEGAHAMTFERGIDGATLACGSGALSVARVIAPLGESEITMPGGVLRISYTKQVSALTGPVRFIGDFQWTRWRLP